MSFAGQKKDSKHGDSGPSDGTQDLFLELTDTIEQPEFDGTLGDILNRGFLQAEISLHGQSPSSGGGISNIVFYNVLLLARTPNSTAAARAPVRSMLSTVGSRMHTRRL